MDTWISFISRQTESQFLENPGSLAQLFTFDIGAPQVAAIQSSLATASEAEISAQVDNYTILDNDWPGLVIFIKNYATWCALIDPQHPENCFVLYSKCFQSLQQAYSNSRGACLNLVVRELTHRIMQIFGKKGNMYLDWIASVLIKFHNSVRSERDAPPVNVPSKKSNVLFYANMLSRAYFQTEQFVFAGSIYSNMHSVGVQLSQFPLSEQVEYRYWAGRHAIYKNDVYSAYIHLEWALSHCLFPSSQYTLILEWLIIPAILVGKIPRAPTVAMLSSSDAQDAVNAVAQVAKSGDYQDATKHMLQTNKWVEARFLRPVLARHLPQLAYRRCIKRIILKSTSEKLPLSLARTLFRLDDPDLLISESIVGSLIANGILKGKVLPKSQAFVVKNRGSMPPLLEVYKLQHGPEDRWLSM